MVTAALIKFMLGIFFIFFAGWVVCVLFEYWGAQADYANEQAKKKIAYAESHKKDSEDMSYWLEYYFGEEKCNEN